MPFVYDPAAPTHVMTRQDFRYGRGTGRWVAALSVVVMAGVLAVATWQGHRARRRHP